MDIPQPHRKPFYKRWWFWLLAVFLLLIIVVSIFSIRGFKKSQIAAYEYLQESVTVEERDLKKTISTNGTIVPEEVTALTASVPGKVEEVLAEVGEEVNTDDVLLRVGSQDILSPFDGRVISVSTFAGDAVSPGIPLIEVGYRTSHIEFLASDSEVVDLQEGQQVNVTIPSYKNGKETFDGEVDFVGVKKEISGSSASQSVDTGYPVHVVSTDIPEEIQKIVGLTVDVEVIVEEKDNTLSLVAGAIQYDRDDKPFVYLVPTIDKAFVTRAQETEDIATMLEKQEVNIGFEADEYTEITDGLKEGEEVLLYVPSSSSSF